MCIVAVYMFSTMLHDYWTTNLYQADMPVTFLHTCVQQRSKL